MPDPIVMAQALALQSSDMAWSYTHARKQRDLKYGHTLGQTPYPAIGCAY